MSYRHYLYLAEKKIIETVSSMTLVEAEQASEEDRGIRELIGNREVHEYGKYLDREIYDAFHCHSLPLFLDKDTAERYSDYDAVVTGKEGLTAAIEAQRSKLLKNIEHDLSLNPEDLHRSYRPTLGLKRVEWGEPLDLEKFKRDGCLWESWLWEYSIFNLIHLYLTVDWDRHELVLMGW